MIRFFLALLISFKIYSQDIDCIKSQDTIYIVLTEHEAIATERFSGFTIISSGNGSINEFVIKDSLKKSIIIRTQNDNKFPNKKINIICNRRKFLKANENKIININFFEKHGVGKIFIDILRSGRKKIVFVIDKTELRKRKITLKKAIVVQIGFEEL